MESKPNRVAGVLVGCGLAGVVLFALKMFRVIDSPWWMVTIPFWAPFAVILLSLVILVVLKLVMRALSWLADAVKKL